jgi:hypothetical protein
VTTVDHALLAKLAWKNETVSSYARALLTQAVRLRQGGVLFFNNDDVPEEFQPGDGNTVGAVFRMLHTLKIIQPWRGSVESKDIWGGMRRSTRECCNGHRNQLYELTNEGIARAWLERHGVDLHPAQLNLFEFSTRSAIKAGL